MADTFTMQVASGSDLSAKQYHVMRQTGANQIDVASLATDSAICGLLDNKPRSREAAAIRDTGDGKVIAGAAITQGVHLTVQGAGRAVAVASGQMSFGRALEAAGADGEMITVRLYTPRRWSGAP